MFTIEIEGKGAVEVKFNMAFLKELNKRHTVDHQDRGKIKAGLDSTLPFLLIGDAEVLSELIWVGTLKSTNRPSQDEIDDFIDNHENVEELFDLVIENLKKQSATKKKVEALIKDIEDQQNRLQLQKEYQELELETAIQSLKE